MTKLKNSDRVMGIQNIKAYKRLKVWEKANDFVLNIYSAAKKFPREELYGIVSQLRRAALSIAANIVEGHASSSKKDFLNFLNISNKSLVECEYILELSTKLGYINEKEYQKLDDLRREVSVMLRAFMRSIRDKL